MESHSLPGAGSISLARGRLYIALAALLWSLSGAFTKLLTRPTVLELNEPELPGLLLAFCRVLFAGLALLPTLRPRDISFRPTMLVMVAFFATMNALYVSAMAAGSAANAVLLQYTAPMWMYLASIWLLGEAADRRSSVALVTGLCGIGVILWGGWQSAEVHVLGMALGSGFAYAGVIICLRVLREASSNWLTVLNHLCGALAVAPFLWFVSTPWPTPSQWAFLAFFGAVQMALPYWFMARGLRIVSAQEAGAITLLEPLLNPLWAFLVAPETETPGWPTFAGGALILGGLAWRYWPRA
jgi:drug/metabolite transporter (DMT)-like permease